MRTPRLTPYVDPLAREVSNPHRTLVGWLIEQAEPAPGDQPGAPEAVQRKIEEDSGH